MCIYEWLMNMSVYVAHAPTHFTNYRWVRKLPYCSSNK